jgi:hypothetical protein
MEQKKESARKHIWQGEWIDDPGLEERISLLPEILAGYDELPECTLDILLPACKAFYGRITSGNAGESLSLLKQQGLNDDEAWSTLMEVAEFARPENILTKVRLELGSATPWIPCRPETGHPSLESWKPLGVLFHITPSNALSVAPMSVVEGLMAGNINILKNSRRNGLFAQSLLKMLADCDPSGILGKYIFVLDISSGDESKMSLLYRMADGVSAWGGEEAIRAVRSQVPSGVRFIEWGHKISFGYITEALMSDPGVCRAFAHDICLIDQQACSSPQTILAETADMGTLDMFASLLFSTLKEVSPEIPGKSPSLAEQAEITTRIHLHRAEAAAGNGKIFGETDSPFHVLVDYRPGLSPSPLFRTIWIHPIRREEIGTVLRPMNIYLQTCGLACTKEEATDICHRLTKAGVIRITAPGEQLISYTGAPHDAVYALQRFSKRISYNTGTL